jgi:DNA-binding Lrp family transcriptional regulator
MVLLNKKSLALLSCLRKNSREKLTKISRHTQIPISTLFDNLKALQGKVITRNTVLLDFSQLGFHAQAHVFVKVDRNSTDQFLKHLICNENTNNVHKVNGKWDFVLETVHKNLRDLDKFLEGLETQYGIQDKEIHYLVCDVKREGFAVSSSS